MSPPLPRRRAAPAVGCRAGAHPTARARARRRRPTGRRRRAALRRAPRRSTAAGWRSAWRGSPAGGGMFAGWPGRRAPAPPPAAARGARRPAGSVG
eukprot:2447686-Pyramimonas_sp.AAC.1